MTPDIVSIKYAWMHGVNAGIAAAQNFVAPPQQSEGCTWRELATLEFEATDDIEVLTQFHVWHHGFVYGYYFETDRVNVPAADLGIYDLAVHMQESMAYL